MRATRPETPAAIKTASEAGRYSFVMSDDDRDTIPPSAPDAADVERFERDVRVHGEEQARLRNLVDRRLK